MLKKTLLGFIMLTALFSCKKKTNENTFVNVNVKVDYVVGSEVLQFDSIRYINASANQYSVKNLEYILSGFELTNEANEIVHLNNIMYVNAKTPNLNSFQFTDVPIGNYKSMSFHIGLSKALNISYSLPATDDYINMAWPDMMGGGYHFMKLEGYVLNNAVPAGYALHMGTDTALVTCVINKAFEINEVKNQLKLRMDINKWYEDPYTYNILLDGNYTMSNPALMNKISKNGYNVFNLIQ